MKKNFIQRLLEMRPELRRRTVYLCTKSKSLPCVLRTTGAVSPICSPNKEFQSANDIVQAFVKGDLSCDEFFVGGRVAKMKLQFCSDLYLYADRTISLHSLTSLPESTPLPTSPNDRSKLPCDGFKVDSVPVSTVKGLNIHWILVSKNYVWIILKHTEWVFFSFRSQAMVIIEARTAKANFLSERNRRPAKNATSRRIASTSKYRRCVTGMDYAQAYRQLRPKQRRNAA